MKSYAFNDDSSEGFLIERVRDNLINGRFIQKVSFQESVINPFGKSQVFDRIIYNQLEFTLSQTFPHIEFHDAPRTTQSFISKISEFSEFAVSVVPLTVDLLRWTEAFQTQSKAKAVIVSVQIAGLEIEPGITARMILSGSKDVRAALKLVTRTKNYELEKLHLKVGQADKVSTVQLSRRGSVKLEEADFELLLPDLKLSLPRPNPLLRAQ